MLPDLAPGQVSPRSARKTHPITLLLAALLLLGVAVAALQPGRWHEHWLWATESRGAVRFELAGLQDGWSEQALPGRLPAARVRCFPGSPPTPADRACGADVASFDGVPALFIGFFYNQGELTQLSSNVPWWAHGAAERWAVRRYGAPAARQPAPGTDALQGWALPDGGAVFMNRHRGWNPLAWSAIQWFSPAQCRLAGCPVPSRPAGG